MTEALDMEGADPARGVMGSDGALWFTEYLSSKIGRVTTAGSFNEFPIPTHSSQSAGQPEITAGPDGALWFTEFNDNKIGRVTTGGSFSEFPIPTASTNPQRITTGSDGALWFTEYEAGNIGRITTAGAISEFPGIGRSLGITAGPDGALWFTDNHTGIGRITPAPYQTPNSASPIQVSLVPAFKQCDTAGNPSNASHAAPLAVASCAPASTGAAHMGAQALASASLSLVADNPATSADETDLALLANASDVRASSPTGPDYNPNAGGPDLTLVTRLRMTDTHNGPSQTDSATAADIDFSAPVACSPTQDTAVGSTCSANTSADALMAGAFTGGGQALLQVFRVRVEDSGPNNVYEGGAGDDRLFLQQGVFIP